MNLPDITLLFQMVHFGVAYLILRKLVFEPVLVIIERKNSTVHYLNAKIDNVQAEHAKLTQQEQRRWVFIQKSLSDMTPAVNQKNCITHIKITAPIQVDNVALSSSQKEDIKKILYDNLSDVI